MPLRDDLLNPIPGDNPSGEYLYYTPVYDKIKEARREDDEGPVGEWQRERKLADWNTVMKLAGESLATKTKDLQLAAWLTEAHLRKEGFGEFRNALDMIKGLVENFWDTLYPELEDGDAEFRATPLQWLGNFNLQIHMVPIVRTSAGYSDIRYQESRKVGYKADAESDSTKLEAFLEKIREGKISCDDFDKEFNATPKAWYVTQLETIDGCLESLEALQIVCEEKFGDMAPGWGSLRGALEKVRQTVNILLNRKREKEPDEPREEVYAEPNVVEEVETTYESTAVAAAPAARAVKRSGPLAAEPLDREDAIARVVSAAKFLRTEDAYSPAPYLMLVGLRHGELRAGGETIDARLLEPPPTEIRQQLKQYAMDYNWQGVLDTAEAAIALPCGRGWLDVHRYAAQACAELGYYYAGLETGIKAALRALLTDYPGLLDLTLMDDTPTANAETTNWLKAEVLAGVTAAPAPEPSYAPPPVEPAPVEVESGEPAPPDAWELAREAARGGRIREAMDLLAREAAVERSGRGRFLRRTQLASLCMETGNEVIAHSILDELAAEIDSRRLEEWEPVEAVAHPLLLLYRCLRRQDSESPAAKALFAKICRLDPGQALSVSR
jgi:type VI secretion system protein ImpA